jgi:hypothetical protein
MLIVGKYEPVAVVRMMFAVSKTPMFLSFTFVQPIASVQIECTASPFFAPYQKQIDDIIETKKNLMTLRDIENIVDTVLQSKVDKSLYNFAVVAYYIFFSRCKKHSIKQRERCFYTIQIFKSL